MFKNRSNIFCLYLLIFLGFPKFIWSQTIGSNFSQAQSFTNLHIQQAVGQPYAMFNTQIGTTNQLNQGQILPISISNTRDHTFECKIYPNPVVDETTITINPKSHIRKIAINDINGKRIYQYNYNSNQNSQKINLDKLSAGVYVLTVYNTNGDRGSFKVTKISTAK